MPGLKSIAGPYPADPQAGPVQEKAPSTDDVVIFLRRKIERMERAIDFLLAHKHEQNGNIVIPIGQLRP